MIIIKSFLKSSIIKVFHSQWQEVPDWDKPFPVELTSKRYLEIVIAPLLEQPSF